MDIRKIIPNIPSDKMKESRIFYEGFLGLTVVMDMEWILTFASPTHPTAQLSIVKKNKPGNNDSGYNNFNRSK